MSDSVPSVSDRFRIFGEQAPRHAAAWMAAVGGIAEASALDRKTHALAYLAVLAALRLESGLPFHVQMAKRYGASREEVISAVLAGLPAAGIGVTAAVAPAVAAYDAA